MFQTAVPTTNLTEPQLLAAVRLLHRDGWEYVEDRAYPVSDDRRIGWWINPTHPTKNERTGDSRPFWYATQTTYDLYSGHSREELG